MILSIEHSFAFLCTPKCASTAIEDALRPFSDIVISGPPGLKHVSFRSYRDYVLPLVKSSYGEIDIESICIMREPLDWANSWYRYRSRKEIQDPGHEFHRNFTGNMSFAAFVESLLEEQPPSFATIGSQASFVGFDGHRPGVDRVFSYAKLDSMKAFLSEKVGKKLRIRRKNISPSGESGLDAELGDRFRQKFAADYQLYNSLD